MHATPDDAFASQCPAVAVQRSDADEGSDLAPVKVTELRELGQQRRGDHGAYAWNASQQLVLATPTLACADGGVDGAVDLR